MKPAIRASAAAERALLGSVIAYPELRHTLILDRADFYDQRHSALWATVTGSKVDLDLAGLVAVLDAKKLTDLCGGLEYVASLVDGLPSPAHAPVLAEQVRQLAALRRAQRSILEVVTQPLEYAKATGLVADALNALQGAAVGAGPVHVGEALAVEVQRIRETSAGKITPPQVMTGFPVLDATLGGFRPGQLILLAARPKVGKSALALQVARNAAGRGKRVLVVSLEMSVPDLMCRLLAAEIGGLSVSKLIRGDLAPATAGWDDTAEMEYVEQAEAKLKALPLWFESGEVGLTELRVMARTHQAKHGLDLVIVDYLGLMRAPQANSRYGEVSALSRGLKLLAGELGLPLLVLSQLNRNIEYAGNGREPILSDLRDSGSLEQDADVVIFLHRNVSTEQQEEQELTKVIVAANRSGPADRCQLRYLGRFTKFVEGGV